MSIAGYRGAIDYETSGPRCDVTSIFAEYDRFAALVDDLAGQLDGEACDVVVGLDALGFILGTAIAQRLHVGFVPIRRGGKLPVATDAVDCVDYTGERKRLELKRSAIRPRARVLIVDDWIETGAQVSAAIELVERQHGIVCAVATIHMDDNERTARLRALSLYPGARRGVAPRPSPLAAPRALASAGAWSGRPDTRARSVHAISTA